MERVVIRHLSGSKANQSETFPFAEFRELTLGRDPSAGVRFDPERDDLVSRMHAVISCEPPGTPNFFIVDLHSRNGTYVNRQKINAKILIGPGDRIQLGLGGPELEFDVEPRPALARPTRVSTGPTREIPSPQPHPPEPDVTLLRPPKEPIGRATTERLIAQSVGSSKRLWAYSIAGVLVVLLAVAGGLFLFNLRQKAETEERIQSVAEGSEKKLAQLQAEQPKTASQIAQEFADSVVFIEMAWKLIDTSSGKQVFQKTVATCVNGNFDRRGRCLSPSRLPAFLTLPDNSIEPWLTLEDNRGVNLPVGHAGTGSGFVVNDGGFILTNRHVAASWQTRATPDLPGIACDWQAAFQRGECENSQALGPDLAGRIDWVPFKPKLLSLAGANPLSGKVFEGRLDYLDVTFPKTKLRIPARLVRVSDRADVALIKIDVPQQVKPVQLAQDDAAQPGDAVTVLGYPGVSANPVMRVKSVDPMNRQEDWAVVPEPTVTPGNVGKVMRSEAATVSQSYDYYSEVGDAYQLTINATGPGNSGGPVFDSKGRVIGIFTLKSQDSAGTQITYAVPIRHGREVMGIQRVMQ